MNHKATARELMRHIQTSLAQGVVTLATTDPPKLRHRLYEMAKRRGYRWKFATDMNSVYISLKRR